MIHFESQLERDFCFHLEFDPVVIRFREQPIMVQLCYQGKNRNYTPDLAVERASGITIYEVKPHWKAVLPEMQDLFEAAAEHFSAQGYRFSVVTDADIQCEPFLQNIKLLNRYADGCPSNDAVAGTKTWLREHGKMPVAALAEILGGSEEGLRLVYRMIALQFIVAPLHSERLGPDTLVGL